MTQWVLASGNSGKLREFQHLLKDTKFQLLPQGKFSVPEVAETGNSFIENAIIKARHASQLTQLPALADDSGLMVTALQGAPGIYSARYAKQNASDEDNRQKLLRMLKGVPEGKRQAQFYCAIVLCRSADDPAPLIGVGTWSGQITEDCQGHQGFGYDPLFYLATLKKTAAELGSEIKNKLSHRAKAWQQLASQLID